MLAIIINIILIIIGGIITFFSLWLLLHTSDRRVLRLIRSPLRLKVSKEYREANAALIAVIIMIMGTMILGLWGYLVQMANKSGCWGSQPCEGLSMFVPLAAARNSEIRVL